MDAHRPEHWKPLSTDSIFLPSHFSAIKTEKKVLMAEKCEGRNIRFKSAIRLLKLDRSFVWDNSQINLRSNFRQLMLRRSLVTEYPGTPGRSSGTTPEDAGLNHCNYA
jgi:hypothetical protein